MKLSLRKKSQHGAALLIFMLILVMASSYALVSKLNTARKPYVRDIQTSKVLAEAKNALIAYAVNFPERSGTADTTAGPGYLSCPDSDNDGSPNSSCGPNAQGRFPGEFLNVSNYDDSSGHRLWYAVSDNFRNNAIKFQPMNSDTPGQLSIDVDADGDIDAADITDVVAVIIAPGEPVTGQDNRPSNTIADYLEGENADGDSVFAFNTGGNDRLVYISRQELMSAIEKRILADVEDSINTYQSNHNAFPWLSPFTDPSNSAFRSTVATYQGALPFHWAADPDSIFQGGAVAGRNPFTTDINVDWTIVNASTTDPGTTRYGTVSGYDIYGGSMVTPDINCVENSTCADANYAGLSIVAPITFANASCTWSNRNTFQCTGSYVNTVVNNYPRQLLNVASFAFAAGADQWVFLRDTGEVVQGEGGPYCFCWQTNVHTRYAYTETITRTYTINLNYTDTTADAADINPPTNISLRTRDLTVDSNDNASALNAGNSTITITVEDDRQIVAPLDGGGTYTNNIPTSTRALTNDADTTGSITATGLVYDLDIDNSELPTWFVANDWQDLIYVSYASGEPLPGNSTVGQDCSSLGANCLTVTKDGTAINNIRAVAISAGTDLNAARPSALLTDYMDNVENTDLDDFLLKNTATLIYNDQTRVISTAP